MTTGESIALKIQFNLTVELLPGRKLDSLHISETSDYFLEEFADELAPSESFPPGNDDMTPEDVIKEVKCLLTQSPLANYSLDNDLINTILEMFTDEHALDYSSPANMDDYGRMTFFMKHETDI
ncbi:hypothetical protein Tco_0952050 [Tanacetum coccineum]|uniref:Uncharacterized protein n=1 Tax=Tanacetum coccineum TaxID=301880 RepID=A0ABQ5DVZ8_9ASTR